SSRHAAERRTRAVLRVRPHRATGQPRRLAAFSAAAVYSNHSAPSLPTDRSALMAPIPSPGSPLIVACSLTLLSLLTTARTGMTQPIPADEVRKLQEAYRTERRQADESGAARKSSPQTLQRAG